MAMKSKWLKVRSEGLTPEQRRLFREQEFGERYVVASDDGHCVYCGCSPSKLYFDHVPALAVAASHAADEPHWLYPACWECNGALGAFAGLCVVERAEFAFQRSEAVHRKMCEEALKTGDATDVAAVAAWQEYMAAGYEWIIAGRPVAECRCGACRDQLMKAVAARGSKIAEDWMSWNIKESEGSKA